MLPSCAISNFPLLKLWLRACRIQVLCCWFQNSNHWVYQVYSCLYLLGNSY